MSRGATLSALGLYDWDRTLFDLMLIPAQLDKPLLINNLLAETAELEVLYPNPVIMKSLIGAWSAKQLSVWQHLYDTTGYVYDPIENYNRMEIGSETGTGSTTRTGTQDTTDTTTARGAGTRNVNVKDSGQDILDMTRRDGGTETEQVSSSSEQGGQDSTQGSAKKEHWVAGFNPGTPSGSDDGLFKSSRDQDTSNSTVTYGKTEECSGSRTTTFGKTETGQDTTTYGKTEKTDETRSDTNVITRNGQVMNRDTTTEDNTGKREVHAHGNIGVTTTQELIRQEREIARFNLYDIIIEDFKARFCVLVY